MEYPQITQISDKRLNTTVEPEISFLRYTASITGRANTGPKPNLRNLWILNSDFVINA
jgi:hypothetical protein